MRFLPVLVLLNQQLEVMCRLVLLSFKTDSEGRHLLNLSKVIMALSHTDCYNTRPVTAFTKDGVSCNK